MRWLSVLLALSIGVGTACAAKPGAPPGYQKVFEDDFSTLSSTWSRKLWYEPESAPASDLYARDGHLNIVARRSTGYIGRNAATSLAPGVSKSFRQGYFEARLRWTQAKGAWPAFWLFSTHWRETGDCSTLKISELDIFEGDGARPRGHSGVLHRNTAGYCSQPDEWNANYYTPDAGNLSGWHVYSALWTATEVIWYVDGRELKRAPVWDSTNQPMYLVLTQAIHAPPFGPDVSSPEEIRTEVDWVRVWQEKGR